MQWEQQLQRAEKGRTFWDSLVEEYGKQAVFFLCCDPELQEEVLPFLPDFLEKKGYGFGVMLTLDQGDCSEYSRQNSPQNAPKNPPQNAPKNAPKYSFWGESELRWKTVTNQQQEALLCCYEMYQFTSRLRVVSWDRPYGSHLASLKGKYPTQTIIETCVLF